MSDEADTSQPKEPALKKEGKFKTLREAQEHLTSLIKKLESGIYACGQKAAEKDSKTKPIIVTPAHLEDGFYFLVKNPPRIKYYRFCHTIAFLAGNVGVGFIVAPIFQTDGTIETRLLFAGLGVTILIISLLVDVFIIDQPPKA